MRRLYKQQIGSKGNLKVNKEDTFRDVKLHSYGHYPLL